jgi:uncharacterized protein with NAD-binding domain and iron-sulfur cluster
MTNKKVVVLGGGVAGMSVAHELIQKDYSVEVFERNMVYCGGKARSVNVPGTNTQEKDKFLPGEHGFRFFPGFYKHITATMKEIPFKGKSKNVFGNLTKTTRIMLARYHYPNIVTIANFPGSKADLEVIIHDIFGTETGLTKEEEKLFATKLWQLMTSSYTRRDNDYERIAWWDYLEAEGASASYISLLVEGLTRTLVAAQAKTASTKTGGNIFLQLIYNMMSPGVETDRVLNGPTNDKWLRPWYKHLKTAGVKYHLGHTVEKINISNGVITSARVKPTIGEAFEVEADHFIMAMPVEAAAPLLTDDITKIDPTLNSLVTLATDTSWMNGIQYYLNKDVPIVHGHCIYSDSEWAVTSISQMQFWGNYDLSKRYNGKVKGILSVDVSDWKTTEYEGKLAEDCEPLDVADMVFKQITDSLNVKGEEDILNKDMIEYKYVDRDIQWQRMENENIDKEPLLVNKVNTWQLRPEAYCAIPNLFFASDYVRTNTDLATMEGANEAARRAVNAILERDNSTQEKCKVWSFGEPWFFTPLKWWDKKRYQKGLPYSEHPPIWLKVFMFFWGGAYLILNFLKALWYELMNKIRS